MSANDPSATHIRRIRDVFPDIVIETHERHNGQFNDIVIVNNALVFRFPRSVAAAETLDREIVLLTALQGALPLPIPDPIYSYVDPATGRTAFMGYPLLPGVPLEPQHLTEIDDETTLDDIATQLATFLRALHRVPLDIIGTAMPVAEDQADWSALYADFREQLFPLMRPDAREAVSQAFDTYLNESRHFAFTPAMRHGDFGIGNILFDPATRQVSGIIDFGSAGPGDPAQDLGALLASFGRTFVERMHPAYPELEGMLERATFFTSTYALQQALDALRDGDEEMFEDGIDSYR